MSADMFALLQANFDAQMPPHVRMVEPTPELVAANMAVVLSEWRDDEARFIETLCDALCDAKPRVQQALASMAHQGDHYAFGKAALVLFEASWNKAAKHLAIDRLNGDAS